MKARRCFGVKEVGVFGLVGTAHLQLIDHVAYAFLSMLEKCCQETGCLWEKRATLVFSWPNWWNVEYTPGPSSSLRYVDEVLRYYRPLWDRNIAVDVISPDRDLIPIRVQ